MMSVSGSWLYKLTMIQISNIKTTEHNTNTILDQGPELKKEKEKKKHSQKKKKLNLKPQEME